MKCLIVTVVLVLLCCNQVSQAKEAANKNSNQGQQQAPLGNLDNMLKQANGVKVDAIMDSKMASNVTNALNDMAMNLRKMFMENRRLSNQVQEVLQRVQNATGVNATNAIGNAQQQAANFSSGNLNLTNLSTLMPRFSS